MPTFADYERDSMICTMTPREAREKAGYGGKEGLERLARKVRRSVRTLLKVERGERPCIGLADRLIWALNCDPKVFLHPTDYVRERNRARSGASGRVSDRVVPTPMETPVPTTVPVGVRPCQDKLKAPRTAGTRRGAGKAN